MLFKEQKTKIAKEFGISENDTGSSRVQIGLITARINQIATHLKSFAKDFHSRRGLVNLVGHRRRLLNYLKKTDKEGFVVMSKQIKQPNKK